MKHNVPIPTYYAIQIIIMLFLLFTQQVSPTMTITLYPSNLNTNTTPVQIYNSSQTPPLNSLFIESSYQFDCSVNTLYTYSQSLNAYKSNSPYFVLIQNNDVTNTQNLNVTIISKYKNFQPRINNSSWFVCPNFQPICNVSIQNNCDLLDINTFNYFNLISISVQNNGTSLLYFTYNVLCNSQYQPTFFQYGIVIQIIFSTILITIVAVYSKAWSISGAGIRISLPLVIAFNLLLIVGGVVGVFDFTFVAISVYVLSWIFGLAGVWLCTNQLLFLLSCFSFLKNSLVKIKTVSIRVMDILSLLASVAVCLGWWFSNQNWILNNVVAVSMIISGIKFFKFTSLKQAVVCFSITITVQMIFVFIITFQIKGDYNTAILNIFNNPFELQLPAINPVYNQKCAWLPITAIIYPGALMAYMRRFDTSRNTKVYIITCVSLFFIGSLLWMFISIASKDSWPYGLVAEPATLGFISFFAWKRKEIKTVWSGQFYDQQFADKEGLKTISVSMQKQRGKTQITYKEQLFAGLELKDQQSSIEYSERNHSQIQESMIEERQKRVEPGRSYKFEKESLKDSLITDRQLKQTDEKVNIGENERISKFPVNIRQSQN